MALPEDITTAYAALKRAHEERLAALGVTLPGLIRSGQPTKDALVLCHLYQNFGRPVTKGELTALVRRYYPGTTDVQQARHLANGKGWYILSKRRGDADTDDWPRDSYGLMSIGEAYPGFHRAAREGLLDEASWQALVVRFMRRCATCGSTEGQPNLRNPSALTTLQRGHRNPHLPLTIENCIPQCDECNRPARNYWIWDEDGRPYAVSDPGIVLRSSPEVQQRMFELLRDALDENQ